MAGLIVAMVGAVGVALGGRGGEGAALANAQNVVAGLVGAVRAQAALHQTTARLVIQAERVAGATTSASSDLRTLQVVRAVTDARAGAVWVAATLPVSLPEGVRVVPPVAVAAGQPGFETAPGGASAGAPGSRLETDPAFQCFGATLAPGAAPVAQYFGAAGRSGRVLFLEFAPDGSLASHGSVAAALIVLGTFTGGEPAAAGANRASVRGIRVRRSGAVSRLEDVDGF